MLVKDQNSVIDYNFSCWKMFGMFLYILKTFKQEQMGVFENGSF